MQAPASPSPSVKKPAHKHSGLADFERPSMQASHTRPPLLRPLGSAFYLGLVGLLSGVAAVLPLETAGAQGPLAGLFLGLIGGVLGVFLGLIAEVRKWSTSLFSWCLNGLAFLLLLPAILNLVG